MNPILTFPEFGQDPSQVSGYTARNHEVFSRIFSPLVLGHQAFLPWSAAAASVGLELRATTHWDELQAAARTHQVNVGRLQQGTVDESTVRALVQALDRGTGTASTYFALWRGYGGEVDRQLTAESVSIPPDGRNYLCDGSFRLFKSELAWAQTRCYEQGYRFPVAIWSEDHVFVLATALYQDSYYLSSDRRTLGRLQEAGVDALEIDRNGLLPSTGD